MDTPGSTVAIINHYKILFPKKILGERYSKFGYVLGSVLSM